jgi:hypothetical protein
MLPVMDDTSLQWWLPRQKDSNPTAATSFICVMFFGLLTLQQVRWMPLFQLNTDGKDFHGDSIYSQIPSSASPSNSLNTSRRQIQQ